MSKKVASPANFAKTIKNVLLLERLREVNALLGFTRVESPDEGAGDGAAPRGPLQRAAPTWVPATQVHGEGIFIRFETEALAAWAAKDDVRALDERLKLGHRGWRLKRNLDPREGYPGVRYVLLHTLAHLLIRELALECGYNAASIRERIYADVEDGRDQAGLPRGWLGVAPVEDIGEFVVQGARVDIGERKLAILLLRPDEPSRHQPPKFVLAERHISGGRWFSGRELAPRLIQGGTRLEHFEGQKLFRVFWVPGSQGALDLALSDKRPKLGRDAHAEMPHAVAALEVL